jgi:ATP-dependent Clp protease ATP-binding subunit ClpC
VLARRSANNPVLVGTPGVGKSSIVRGIAARTPAAAPNSSDERILVELSAADLHTNGGRGAFAERLSSIQKEVAKASGRVVLVLEDIHAVLGGDFDADAASEVRLALSKGEFPCIGTSTVDDYRRVIEADPTLARRFSAVLVDEPSSEEALDIVRDASTPLAKHHRVTFDEEVLGASIAWSVRYLPGRALPDKALSILDLAGARASRRGQRDVARELVASVIAEMTDVPVSRMMETETERMLAMESLLGDSVVGHAPMLTRIAAILRRNAAGIRGRRPIGTFLLLGPTGVGKTETAKAIARALFDSPDAMTRLDLSEYAEPHAIARLVGAPPGYVGHEAGGQLTEAVRRRPYQVVLLDEVEKAHRDVLEAFLQVFDEGRLTDGRGRTVDFTNTVLVMTSNLGADAAIAPSGRSIGFRHGVRAEGRGDEAGVIAAARDALAPELYNRIDEVLVFRPLGEHDVREIAKRLLSGLGHSLTESRGVGLVFDDAVCDALLAQGGYDPTLGARPMKRAIAKLIEAPLAELILRGELGEGDVARLTVGPNGEIAIDTPAADDARERTRVVA